MQDTLSEEDLQFSMTVPDELLSDITPHFAGMVLKDHSDYLDDDAVDVCLPFSVQSQNCVPMSPDSDALLVMSGSILTGLVRVNKRIYVVLIGSDDSDAEKFLIHNEADEGKTFTVGEVDGNVVRYINPLALNSLCVKKAVDSLLKDIDYVFFGVSRESLGTTHYNTLLTGSLDNFKPLYYTVRKAINANH